MARNPRKWNKTRLVGSLLCGYPNGPTTHLKASGIRERRSRQAAAVAATAVVAAVVVNRSTLSQTTSTGPEHVQRSKDPSSSAPFQEKVSKMSETNGNKLFFFRDSEAAFGSESATRGGLFLDIRGGKAVVAPDIQS